MSTGASYSFNPSGWKVLFCVYCQKDFHQSWKISSFIFSTQVRSIHKGYQYLCCRISLLNSIFWLLLILPVFFLKYKTETSLIAGCNFFLSQQRGVKQIFVSTFSSFTLHFAINSLIFGRTRTSRVVEC